MKPWWMKYYKQAPAQADGADGGNGGNGSDLITESEINSSVMGGDRKPVSGDADSDDEAWALFEKDVLNGDDDQEETPVQTTETIADESDEVEQPEATADESDAPSDDDSENADTEDDNKESEQQEEKKDEQQGEVQDPVAAREQWLSALESSIILDEATVEQLRVEPEKVLPKLLAQVQANAVETAIKTLVAALPQQIQMVNSYTTEAAKAEQRFYKTWPELAKPEHRETVANSIRAYRQLNPKAPAAEAIKQAGMMAYLTLGLPIGDLANRIGGQDMQEVVNGATAKAGKPVGITPAKSGQSVPAQPIKSEAPKSFYEEWAEEFLTGSEEL